MKKLVCFGLLTIFVVIIPLSGYGQPLQSANQNAPSASGLKNGQPLTNTQNQNTPITITPSAIQWNNVPDMLPPGAQFALLEGNPKNTGEVTIRLNIPANYQVPPAYVPNLQRITVLSGTINFGNGDKFDMNHATALSVGSLVIIPAESHFYLWASEDSVLQISGPGPWTLVYVNAKDDPRHNKNMEK